MPDRFKENEYCICVHCNTNTRIPHKRGIPCRENRCPNYGKIMFKEGSYHHQLYLKKKMKKIKTGIPEGRANEDKARTATEQ